MAMLLKALTAARDIGRVQDIASVLAKHGYGDFVNRTGLAGALQRAGRALRMHPNPPADIPPTDRVRLALEELGPTFVKLGQVLASRPDLLPADWRSSLSKLHEEVATIPYEELREQLEEDLGGEPELFFKRFDREPFAAGSIAQVHLATLPDDSEVVVKIRRPGIEAEVMADLRLLERLAELVEVEVPEYRRFHPKRTVRQFARSMRDELDLRQEERHIQAIAEIMEGHAALVIPTVHEQFTRERLLVMERLDGPSAAEWLAAGKSDTMDAQRLVREGADAVLDMVFEHGLYHADPHPGNVLFLPDGRIGLLDFGMVGRLSESRRGQFVTLLSALTSQDENLVVDVLLRWSDGGSVDVELLTQDSRAFLDRYHGVPLKDLDITQLLRDIAEVVRSHGLVLPSDVTMLLKCFITLEGLGRSLDPDFDMTRHVEPAARRMIKKLHSPRRILRSNVRGLRALLTTLPSDIRSVITRLRRGDVRMNVDVPRLQDFGLRVEHTVNRLTMGIVTASLIIGTSIAMTIDGGPRLFGLPAFGLLGFLTAGFFGATLLWSIVRSGRH